MTREEIKELKGLAASMGLYDDKKPCKRAVILGKAIKALEQEPKAEIALNRYRDLQDYFSDEAVAKTILENQTEFKSWLKRLKWHTKKVDELARKLETLEQEPILNKIRAEIDIARFIDKDTKLCKNSNASGLEVALQILDKYKAESEKA